jgi:dienelactone hydrolase
MMTEVILFHQAQGPTDGVRAFAHELRAAGHVVHAPDLYDGKTFAELADGVGYAEQVGFDTIVERGRLAADGVAERHRLRRLLARGGAPGLRTSRAQCFDGPSPRPAGR